MITTTRTHTRFFDQEILQAMTDLAVCLSDDWESRSGFVDEDTRASGDARILTIFAALRLADEPVPDR